MTLPAGRPARTHSPPASAAIKVAAMAAPRLRLEDVFDPIVDNVTINENVTDR